MVKIIQLLQPVEPLDRLTQLYENKEYDSLYALSVKHQFDFPLDQARIIYYQALSGLLKNTEEPAPFFQLLYLDRTGRYTSKLITKVNSEKPQTRFAGMFIAFLSSQGALEKDSIKRSPDFLWGK